MNVRKIASILLLGVFTISAFGQDVAPEKSVEDKCKEDLSLFTSIAKIKNYKDAYQPWKRCYTTCPAISKNIYILGVRILNWKIAQEKDKVKRDQYINDLMKLYDDRMIYFGGTTQKNAAILDDKTKYFINYFPAEIDTAYTWIKTSVDVLGNRSNPTALHNFVITSCKLYKRDEAFAETFINDYLKANAIIDIRIAKDDKYSPRFKKEKERLELLFATSGAANCDQLDKIYKDQIAKNATDNDYLKRVILFYKRVNCTESKVFFAASEASHKIEPSVESANGCAGMCYKKGDYQTAIQYYSQALTLTTDIKEQAELNFKIANVYHQIGNSPKVRTYCKRSLELNPEQANPHILLGLIYSKAKVSDDNVLSKSAYWAAIDQFSKARSLDDSEDNVKNCNKLISTYSKYFPSKEEIFMHPDLSVGKSYFVGGWVSETTIVRHK